MSASLSLGLGSEVVSNRRICREALADAQPGLVGERQIEEFATILRKLPDANTISTRSKLAASRPDRDRGRMPTNLLVGSRVRGRSKTVIASRLKQSIMFWRYYQPNHRPRCSCINAKFASYWEERAS